MKGIQNNSSNSWDVCKKNQQKKTLLQHDIKRNGHLEVDKKRAYQNNSTNTQKSVLGNTLLEVAGVVLPLLSSLLILYSRELLLYSIFYSETRYSTRILLKSIEKF